MQSIQAPAYHMRMKDLIAQQKVASKSVRDCCAEMGVHLNIAQAHLHDSELSLVLHAARTRLRKLRSDMLSDLSKKHAEERAALRKKHRDARAYEKVEKAHLAPSKLNPEFWTYYPNHDGRRDTMLAVLQSKGLSTDHLTEHMPAYAEWLLTAKKTTEKGPMNPWELMTAFVTEIRLT